MSIIAIALGVAFVVGSFCFREMLNDQVSQMMGSNSDADVYVRGATEQKKDGEDSFGSYNSTYNEISTDIIPDIEKVDGVVSADATHQLSNAVLLLLQQHLQRDQHRYHPRHREGRWCRQCRCDASAEQRRAARP